MLSAIWNDEYFGGGVVGAFVVSEAQGSQSSSTDVGLQLGEDIWFDNLSNKERLKWEVQVAYVVGEEVR